MAMPRTLLTALSTLFLIGCTSIQHPFLFYPTHNNVETPGLAEWKIDGKTIGYARHASTPQNIWLLLHGNAGQAADRTYALPTFSQRDAVFIMEYPGYGARQGQPSKASFDAAAAQAYLALRKTFPGSPICVLGESIGSGPACSLATQNPPPDKIVLVVPFDKLASVAASHVRFLPVSSILEDKWDNIHSLSKYKGPVEIFAASDDTIIPIQHAQNLAESVPSARFHRIPGGHNDWSRQNSVKIKNP
jgi:pimeloyl-ACP methyl ester carboxylesterase